MLIKKIINVLNICEGKNISIFKTINKLIIIDYIIICTSLSKNHSLFILKDLKLNFKKYVFNNFIESDNLNEWILININKYTINIMQEKTRLFYDIDNLFKNYKYNFT